LGGPFKELCLKEWWLVTPPVLDWVTYDVPPEIMTLVLLVLAKIRFAGIPTGLSMTTEE